METRYRIWIVQYEGPRPMDWHDAPEAAVALEPAEQKTMSARHARRYIEAFNRSVHSGRQKIWAVAVPIEIAYRGDPRPGEKISMKLG